MLKSKKPQTDKEEVQKQVYLYVGKSNNHQN